MTVYGLLIPEIRQKPSSVSRTNPGTAVNELLGTRLAISGYIGLVIYCLLSLFLGPMGIKAYSELESRVAQMGENLKSLESLHEEALARLESARSDPEALATGSAVPGVCVERGSGRAYGLPGGRPRSPELGDLDPLRIPRGNQRRRNSRRRPS
jgi:hypothetical protein